MQDQIMTMGDYGIASAAFINSDINKSQQKKILHDAKMGKIKILYVAP
jgi:superfamily II DNA helicase RecQ